MPVAHGEGCYYGDDAALDALERDGQVLWRYANAGRLGRRPGRPRQPERVAARDRGRAQRRGQRGRPHAAPRDGVEAILGSDDGLGIIRSLVVSAAEWATTGSITGAGRRRAPRAVRASPA